MILSLIVSIGAPIALGLLLVRMAWQPRLAARTVLLQLTLACALGIGISSCTFFLHMAWVEPQGPRLASVEPTLFLCIVAVFLAFKRTRRSLLAPEGRDPGSPSGFPDSRNSIPKPLLVGFWAVLACAVAGLILCSINRPHGAMDAYSIWNMRARFMFRGHELWTRIFYPLMSHADYPLLLPSSIGRLWTYMGSDTQRVPQVLAALFTFATVAALSSSLAVLHSTRRGVEAALFLLATASFVRLGGDQYADIPLGFFILSTVILLGLSDSMAAADKSRGLLSLGGTMAGFAAWTKNEGILFVLAVTVALIATTVIRGGVRNTARKVGPFLIGLLPILLVLLYFKVRYAPPNDVFGSLDLGTYVAKLRDLHRYRVIGEAFCKELFGWGNGLIAVFGLYLVVTGISLNRRCATTLLIATMALALVVAGYFFTYVFSPHDLNWHLTNSLDRLLLQLWPTFLFVVFLAIRPLERPAKLSVV